MTGRSEHKMPNGNRKINSLIKNVLFMCFAMLFFQQEALFAQVISNNGAAVSVTSGAAVTSKDALNNSGGTISNGGTINLSGDYTNSSSTLGNGTFRIGRNWTNSGTFYIDTYLNASTVIFNGADNQSIIRTGGETFYNLSIENSGAQLLKTIGLPNDVTIMGTLSMYLGYVNATAYKLYLSNNIPSALNYTSISGSRIIGKFERGLNSVPGTYLFPLGSMAHYNPANIRTNSVSSAGTILSEFVTSPPPGNSGLPFADPPVEIFREYPDGFWDLKANGFSTGDYSINLNGTGFADTIFDITRVIKRTNSGPWTVEGTHAAADTINKVVYRNNLTGNIDPSGTQFALARVRPLILSHPVSLIACEKTNPVFSITATGAGMLTYVWYHNGVAITNSSHYSGNRTNSITIINAVLSDAGTYYCIVRDKDRNSTTSNSATLIVNKIPVATVSYPAQNDECSEVPFKNIILGESYGVPGTTYIWIRTNPAGIITSVPLNGIALNIGDILSGSFKNILDFPVTITFTITPVGPDFTSYAGNPVISNCVGIPVTATVTVNPKPRVIPVTSLICYGGTTSINLISPSVMTQQNAIKFNYNVTATAPPAILPGNWLSGTNVAYGTALPITYTNQSDSLQSVFYNVTPITVPALGCPAGDELPFEIKVHSKTMNFNYPGTNGTGILITKPLTCTTTEGSASLAALRVILSKGAATYHISWTGPVGYINDSADITNLNVGKYSVRVIDNLGCRNDSALFVAALTARPQISATLVLPNTHVSCPGGSDGEMSVFVSAGITQPYLYSVWRNTSEPIFTGGLFTKNFDPTDPTTYRKFTGLKAGSYSLVIVDVNGCIVTKTMDLKEPAPITVPFLQTDKSDYSGFNVSCRGYSNGWVVARPTGGNGSYSYLWSAANGIPLTVSTTTNLLDSVPAGTYNVLITDLLGCPQVASVTLTEPNGMQLVGSVLSTNADGNKNISCNGGNDGSIKLTISGGTGVYNALWTGPSPNLPNTKDIFNLKAGTYVATVTDNNNCLLKILPGSTLPQFTLTEPTALAITDTTSKSNDGAYEINCNKGTTGWINVTVTGGGIGAYQYDWTTSDGSGIVNGQQNQSGLTAGTYHLKVTDSNGCPAIKDFTLTQPQPFVTQISSADITCQSPGFNNGSINLTVAGGVLPYTYAWSNGAFTKDINGLNQGLYRVTVTYNGTCSAKDSVRINLPPVLNYSRVLSDFNGENISCFGQSDGFINVTPLSGLAPYAYTWTSTNGFTGTTQDISNLKAGIYTLKIIDNNFCTATEIINMTEPGKLGILPTLSASTGGGYNINCAGDITGSITLSTVNEVKSVNYLWADGIFGNSRINLPAGNYGVVITDANNCHAASTITLIEPDSIKLKFDISLPFCPDKPNGEIRLKLTGGVIGTDYYYKWSDNSTGKTLSNIPKGFYKVTVNDMNGCSIKDSVIVDPLNQTCLVIPNAISPNGDLINDVLNIDEIELYPLMEVKIFNRWGESIWKSEKGYPKPWDGKSNGANLPIDSYHYIIDLHNGTKPLVGNVTIVR